MFPIILKIFINIKDTTVNTLNVHKLHLTVEFVCKSCRVQYRGACWKANIICEALIDTHTHTHTSFVGSSLLWLNCVSNCNLIKCCKTESRHCRLVVKIDMTNMLLSSTVSRLTYNLTPIPITILLTIFTLVNNTCQQDNPKITVQQMQKMIWKKSASWVFKWFTTGLYMVQY